MIANHPCTWRKFWGKFLTRSIFLSSPFHPAVFISSPFPSPSAIFKAALIILVMGGGEIGYLEGGIYESYETAVQQLLQA